MLRTFGDIVLCEIEDTEVRDWDIPEEATNVKVTLPVSPDWIQRMLCRGYAFGDRTVLCTIPTRRLSGDLFKGVRSRATLEQADHEAMLELAKTSFVGDRRFYVTPDGRQDVAECVLEEWISGLEQTLVCRVKEAYAGFLALTEEGDDALCVNLAATDERYRLAGVAMALYAEAVKATHESGRSRLVGRISSRNMPVMNLYAHLGAKFSDPLDIFLKEVR